MVYAKTDQNNLDMFFKEHEASTEPTDDPDWRVYNGCVDVSIHSYRGCCHLFKVISRKMGSGEGTKYFQFLVDLSDKYNIPLTLVPQRIQNDGPSPERLRKYYSKNWGFVPWNLNPNIYIRHPKSGEIEMFG